MVGLLSLLYDKRAGTAAILNYPKGLLIRFDLEMFDVLLNAFHLFKTAVSTFAFIIRCFKNYVILRNRSIKKTAMRNCNNVPQLIEGVCDWKILVFAKHLEFTEFYKKTVLLLLNF